MSEQPQQDGTQNDYIQSLREEENFLMIKYNEKRENEKMQMEEAAKKFVQIDPITQKKLDRPTRAGGVYVPPHKLREMENEIKMSNKNSVEYQRLMWELLRKSINGIINKVNITNIQNIIVELFNENILRGRGLLARAIIKAQMASPNFTMVYAALISVINTKLPEIVNLIIRRVIVQFQRAYKRNNKIVCMAITKMIAHLINQKVLSDLVGLELLYILLESPTEDSVELACDFTIECGQVMSDIAPQNVSTIFERFKGILHEGTISRKVQYRIEQLFATRKTKFVDHPGVIPDLDLVEEDDQITHQIDIVDELDAEDNLNLFQYDPFFEKTENEWEEIKKEILGEENIIMLKTKQQVDFMPEIEEEQEQAKDFTERDLLSLKRVIYLTIQSSVDYEECLHKIIKMQTGIGHEDEVCNMIIDCCMQERTYLRFFGLLGQRLCEIAEIFRDNFMKCFVEKYATMHRYETAKIRNISKFFAHLFFTNAIDWRILKCISLTQESTTSSGRIMIKCLFLELAENMSLPILKSKLMDPELKDYLAGLFPVDHPKNTRFSINFFTSIGQGLLTEELRQIYEQQNKIEFQHAQEALKQFGTSAEEDSESDESDSSENSSSDDSSDSDSSKDKLKKAQQEKKKKEDEDKKVPNNSVKEKPKEKERGKLKEKEKVRDKDRDKEKEKEREKEKEKEKEREKEKEKEREKEKEKEREKEREREREKEKEREKQKERERERVKQKEKERKREKEREREREKEKKQKEKKDQKKKQKSPSQSESLSDSKSRSASVSSSQSSSSSSESKPQHKKHK